MTDKTIWRMPVVMARTGLARSSIYEKLAADQFPLPINLGPRTVGWIAEEVELWIQERIDESRPDDD